MPGTVLGAGCMMESNTKSSFKSLHSSGGCRFNPRHKTGHCKLQEELWRASRGACEIITPGIPPQESDVGVDFILAKVGTGLGVELGRTFQNIPGR